MANKVTKKVFEIKRKGNTFTITITGSFCFRHEHIFLDVLTSVKTFLKNKIKKETDEVTINIDFKTCTFVDSAALGMLVVLFDEVTAVTDSKINLLNVSSKQKEYMYMCKLDHLFNIEEA